MKISSTDRICVSGLTGSGKTVFMRYLASLAAPHILIIDPLNQYSSFPDELRYIPKRETPNELEEICAKLWAKGNMTLIIEESEQYLIQGRAMLPFTSGLIRMGRNWGVGIYVTTRRIQDLNKRFFDLAQHCFFFRCGLKSREYIAHLIGKEYVWPSHSPHNPNKTGYTLTTLPPYHCLHFNLEDETAEIVTLKMGARPHISAIGEKSDAKDLSPAPPKEEIEEPGGKVEDQKG